MTAVGADREPLLRVEPDRRRAAPKTLLAEGVKTAARPLAWKTNPPYPPLSGGKKKQNPLSPAGRIAFFYPPDKGG